jgi:hypothetical protein
MSLSTLYSEKKTALAPPPGFTQDNYYTYVAKMNSKGTYGNDLVQRDMIDPTFRPPAASTSYMEQVFQDGLNKNL